MSDYIGPLTVPTRTHHAERNGSKVITATAMPEPVLLALVALVDALGAAFKASDDAEREADDNLRRAPCRWHIGQYADYCGPCRSEEIGAAEELERRIEDEPSTWARRQALEAAAEAVRKSKERTQPSATDTNGAPASGDWGPPGIPWTEAPPVEECNGMCVMGNEVMPGQPAYQGHDADPRGGYYDWAAYPHPDCPRHGDAS